MLCKLSELLGIGPKKLEFLNNNGIYTILELSNSKFFNTLPEITKNIINYNFSLYNVQNFENIDMTDILKKEFIIMDIEFLSTTGKIFSICALDNEENKFIKSINDFDIKNEREMIFEFLNFVNGRICFAWGNVENQILEKSKKRLNIDFNIKIINLHSFCVKNNILFKWCWNYKLKHIGNNLNYYNFINYNHNNDFGGYELYQLFLEWNKTQYIDTEIMDKILKYNFQDVELLDKIKKFIITSYKLFKELN